MAHLAVTAIGADRPGIVAALTGALHDLEGNLEDVSSTILRGHFAMMLVADIPAPADDVRAALDRAVGRLGVAVTVADVEAGAPERPRATHVLTAHGADRPGIVAGLSGLLADRGANVTDLSCRLTDADRPVYVLVAEVEVPEAVDAGSLTADVTAAADELGVEASLRPIEVETL